MKQPAHRHCATTTLLRLFLLGLLWAAPLLAAPQPSAQDAKSKEQELLENTKQVAEGKLALNGVTNDTWMIATWEFIRDHAVRSWEWLSSHVHAVLFEDFMIDEMSVKGVAILLILLTLMFLSGAWAASIAQSRRHPRLPNFLFGFFTFFAGPAYLLYHMDIKGEQQKLERLAEEAAAKRAEAEEKARLEAAGKVEKGYQAPAVSANGVVWDEKYFLSIQRKDDGTPDGPWQVTYNNVSVLVLEILEVLPNLVAVRLVNQEGQELRSRIPYARITQWDRALPPLPAENT